MEKDFALTPLEVAELLKISKNTVYELVKRGEINSYRVGNKVRIEMKDIEEYKNKSKKLQNIKQGNVEQMNSYTPILSPYESEKIQKSYGFVICGQDIMLDILSRHLQQHTKGFQALRSYVGSYDGLYALYHGNVQIATAHLWDGETGQYNIPYVKRMLPGIPTLIVHLANCLIYYQGIYNITLKGFRHLDHMLEVMMGYMLFIMVMFRLLQLIYGMVKQGNIIYLM